MHVGAGGLRSLAIVNESQNQISHETFEGELPRLDEWMDAISNLQVVLTWVTAFELSHFSLKRRCGGG